MDLGSRLKEARERGGLSQEALARQADVSTVAVSQIEQGRTKEPHYLTLHRLSQALGVSPHWLYTGEEEKEPVLPKGDAPESGAGRSEIVPWVHYIIGRAKDIEIRLKDPDSEVARDPKAALEYADIVTSEGQDLLDVVMDDAIAIGKHEPVDEEVGRRYFAALRRFYAACEAVLRRYEDLVQNRPEDELAQRRVNRARARAQEQRNQAEELEAAAL